jgi:hypothetical protein
VRGRNRARRAARTAPTNRPRSRARAGCPPRACSSPGPPQRRRPQCPRRPSKGSRIRIWSRRRARRVTPWAETPTTSPERRRGVAGTLADGEPGLDLQATTRALESGLCTVDLGDSVLIQSTNVFEPNRVPSCILIVPTRREI